MSNAYIPSESSSEEKTNRPEVLKVFFEENFKMPDRLLEKGSDGFCMDMCRFLIDEGYIKTKEKKLDTELFSYFKSTRCIQTGNPLTKNSYDYYFFRLGFFF